MGNMVGCKSNSLLAMNYCEASLEGAWSDDLICSGHFQAQLRAESWVGEFVGFGPSADEAEHSGLATLGGDSGKGCACATASGDT